MASANKSQSNFKLNRPAVPSALQSVNDVYLPSSDFEKWIRNLFLEESSPFFNPEHLHLLSARIGVVLTNCYAVKGMRAIAGQAETPHPQGGKWQKGRALYQLERWFGLVPDFIITLYSEAVRTYSDIELCALMEHELYHCAQKTDDYGCPLFNKTTGLPKFGVRAHDVEEFSGIIRRYGVEASSINVKEFVEAAKIKAELKHLFDSYGKIKMAGVCGSCPR